MSRSLPAYVVKNLNRTQELFPDANIIFVSDAEIPASLKSEIVVIRPQFLNWPKDRIALNRDKRFWSGWWQKTFDRLLFIRPVHALYPDRPIVQVEADVILFPSFLSSGILNIEKIAYPRYSSSLGIASVLYSPNFEMSLKLEQGLLNELKTNPSTSDMTALGALASALGDSFQELYEFEEGTNARAAQPKELSLSGFDGASHGEWICGRDPRAHWGIGMRLQRTPISETRTMPKYSLEENQLYALVEGVSHKVHNLHVHSKELVFFDTKSSDVICAILDRVNGQEYSSLYTFNLQAFVFCLYSNLKIWLSSIFSIRAWKRLAKRYLVT
jgi:hypothetical protein